MTLKMTTKIKTLYITSLSLVLTITSCDSFTDIDIPGNQLTTKMVFSDDALAKSAMASVLRSLTEKGFLSGVSSGGTALLGCYTDELVSYQPANSDLSQMYFLTHNARGSSAKLLWESSYSQLYSVNAIIEGVNNSPSLSKAVKDQLLGEALFIRGLLHFYLTSTYGSIPYVTTTDYEVNRKIPKKTTGEVYTLAEEDLLQALSLLPQTLPKGNRIRPSKIAIYTVLARLALYDQGWSKAIEYATMVIGNSSYAIDQDLSKVFLKNSSSAIWQLEPISGLENTHEGGLFVLETAPPTNVAMSTALVGSFENGDQRKSIWVGKKSDTNGNDYYFPYKYKKNKATASSEEYSTVLRTEELYLIRAEAFLESGQTVSALNDLNVLRNRAGLTNITSGDSAVITSMILNEYRHEFFTELGNRFYTLKRKNRLSFEISQLKPGWKDYYSNFPIPESELLLNPNLLPQNNGY